MSYLLTEADDRNGRVEIECLRRFITRNLVECCENCRALLREQLEREEARLGRCWPDAPAHSQEAGTP